MVSHLAALALTLSALAWRRLPRHPGGWLLMAGAPLFPSLTPLALLAAYGVSPLSAALARRRLLGRMEAWFPDLLLLLRMSAENGLGAVATMLHLPSDALGPLAAPLKSFRDDLLHSSDLSAALARLSSDLAFPSGQNLISALRAGETLGVPLRQTMAAQESISRQARLSRIRRQAGFVPYLLTVMAGLFMINAAILFGYPHLVALIRQFGILPGKGIL